MRAVWFRATYTSSTSLRLLAEALVVHQCLLPQCCHAQSTTVIRQTGMHELLKPRAQMQMSNCHMQQSFPLSDFNRSASADNRSRVIVPRNPVTLPVQDVSSKTMPLTIMYMGALARLAIVTKRGCGVANAFVTKRRMCMAVGLWQHRVCCCGPVPPTCRRRCVFCSISARVCDL